MAIGCTFCKSQHGAYAGQLGYVVSIDLANGRIRVGYKPKNGQKPYEIDAEARHYSFGYGIIRNNGAGRLPGEPDWYDPWDVSGAKWKPYAEYYGLNKTPRAEQLRQNADIVGEYDGEKVYEYQGNHYVITGEAGEPAVVKEVEYV